MSRQSFDSAMLGERGGRWIRRLAVAAAVLFAVSCVFPVAAGLSKDTSAFPRWWGPLDVGLAGALAVIAIAVTGVARDRVSPEIVAATYRAYRVLLHGIFGLLVVFFAAGDRITWSHCITGFGWRAWLLAYCLPSWLAAWATPRWGARTATDAP